MKVSRNELNAALKRAYEGAGYDIGDYEDAAEFITWSEMCGFGAFSRTAMPPVGPKGAATPRLVYEGGSNAVIDAGGADACQYGSLAAHLCYSKARHGGFSTLQLENCSNPGLILRGLSLIAQRGVYLATYWRDDEGDHGASFEQGAIFPNYWCVPGPPSDFRGHSTITILCTTQAGLLADAVARQTEYPNMSRQERTAAQLAVNYNTALWKGIAVEDKHWKTLNAAAWPILVSATEQSRQGAGPG